MKVINGSSVLPAESVAARAERSLGLKTLPENEIFGDGLLENLPNAVLIFGPDTSIWYVNPALENLTGFTSSELVGKKIPYPWWIRGINPDNGDNHVETIPRSVKNFELYRKKNGEAFWAEVTSVPVIRDGEVRHYISSWIDITKYKKGERQFIELSNYYRTGLDGIMHGVLVTDKSDFIQYSNENMRIITGISPEKIYGKSILSNQLDNTIGGICNHYFKAKLTLRPQYHDEIPAITPNGQKTYHSIYLVPIIASGVFNGMFITIEDVNERVKVENELSKYEELNKFKNDLLARVSHELRTPLASIKGYSTLLLEYEPRLERKEKREYLESIDNATTTLTKLVSQLLEISRFQAGLHKFKKHPTNILELLQQVIAEAKLRAPKNEIVNDLENWLPSANIDADRIKQVMENLIENALKYSSEGSRIIVSAHRKEQELLVSVADNGIGIPEDELEKVFTQMYRIQEAQSLTKPGLGLGLAICREIIEVHGGKIWAESQPGKGSVFHFLLPIENHVHKRP